ncbi:hypothetical protein [Phormidium sp. CCY1219]|jgi:hypothetical protein|uniref:hypothetical protein n=1 Tax=Phormidium sp. CCY1219 TaxID=2886104 RepID=UPI002D1EFF08|nr:hypothetical protein [Phormidium sp. CCY1219]MEB3829816.1 hypothetical protein [Phormidium sp. CCY1219]
MNKSTEREQLNETLTAIASKHGLKVVAEELRDYAVRSRNQIGLPEALETCWENTARNLENIIEDWEKAEEETKP